MDHVVLDLEIARTIEETPGGWEATDQLGVAVAVLYEAQGQRFRIYGPEDVPALQRRLLAADRVTTFNGWSFDLPVIWGLPRPQRVLALEWSSDDLLRRIWQAQGLDPDVFSDRHKGWGLDAVCEGTLGARKIGSGGEAPKWFQAGQWAKVVNYCADDVALTRDLCMFMDRYGYVVHPRYGRLGVPPWTERPRG
jgi:DEAD/DEAH box helicase domain-containing protein